MAYNFREIRDRLFGIRRNGKGGYAGIEVRPDLTPSEALLILALLEFAPNIAPSINTLASMLGVTPPAKLGSGDENPLSRNERDPTVAEFVRRYEAQHGTAPPITPQDRQHANDLREAAGTTEKALRCVQNAFADDWWAAKATLAYIARNPSRFAGSQQAMSLPIWAAGKSTNVFILCEVGSGFGSRVGAAMLRHAVGPVAGPPGNSVLPAARR